MARETLKGEARITSYGGVDGAVTGSLHLYENGQKGQKGYRKVLFDMGMFQGVNDLGKMENSRAREVETIEKVCDGNPAILLSHAHFDHYGFLVMIYKYGYNSTVYATEETKKIIEKNLRRSAISQKNRCLSSVSFDIGDVNNALGHIKIVQPFKEVPISRDGKMTATFCLNGHIPGASSILLKDRSPGGKNVLYTGDIGRPEQSLTGGYERFWTRYPQDSIDVIMTESTNYTNTPISFQKRVSVFQETINRAFDQGDVILMPCIQHRQMENIEIIRNSQRKGELPRDITFFRDGPALVDIADIYRDFPADYLTTRYGDNPNYYNTESSQSRFDLNNLYTIRSHQESIAFAANLGRRHKKTLVFASGGMGEDGRINNYLRTGFVERGKGTLAFSCFLVSGTRGANLLEHQNQPSYRGVKVVRLEGGSSHATGSEEVLQYLERYNLDNVSTFIIGHGSETSMKSMEIGLRRRSYGEYADIKTPRIGEVVPLS